MNAAVARWLALDARAVMRVSRLDVAALEALRRQRLVQMLRVAARTDYYADRLAAVGADAAAVAHDPYAVLARLPPVSKRELRAAGDGVFVGGRIDPSWCSSRSSGSTGEPFRVYYDARSWATLKYLVKLRARFACGMRLSDRIASLEALSLSELGAPRTHALRRMQTLNVLRPAPEVAEALVRFRPTIVMGLPSALLEAVQALRMSGERLPVRMIFTGGELLSRATRRALETGYAARVFDVYGTSETKEIAWECRLGAMHVNADLVHVEVVDDEGRAQPVGEEGEIVATLLRNEAMPLVRYRTGDWGRLLPESCACGRATPLMGIGTGRQADMLLFEGGRRVSPYALTCTLEQVPGLLRYQVIQRTASALTVRVILGTDTERALVADRLRAVLRAEVTPSLDVEVEFVDHLPSGPRAKFRVVQPLETL